jgi:hypothetical protein
MFQREQVFSSTDVANYTVQTAEKLNVYNNDLFFWTYHQKNVVKTNTKRFILASEFGTGKTTLLKAKAKQLGRERHLKHLKPRKIYSASGKIFFVVFVAHDALLAQSLKSEMEELKDHIEIISLTSEPNLFKM